MIQNAAEGHQGKVAFPLSSRWWKTLLSFPELSGFTVLTKISARVQHSNGGKVVQAARGRGKYQQHSSALVCWQWFSHLSQERLGRNSRKLLLLTDRSHWDTLDGRAVIY